MIEQVVLAEVQVFFEVGFERLAVGEDFACSGGVVLADKVLFKFGQNIFEAKT